MKAHTHKCKKEGGKGRGTNIFTDFSFKFPSFLLKFSLKCFRRKSKRAEKLGSEWCALPLVRGLRVCGFAGLRVCGFAGLRVCGFAGLRVCGFAGLRVCGFAGLRVCGLRCGAWLADERVPLEPAVLEVDGPLPEATSLAASTLPAASSVEGVVDRPSSSPSTRACSTT